MNTLVTMEDLLNLGVQDETGVSTHTPIFAIDQHTERYPVERRDYVFESEDVKSRILELVSSGKFVSEVCRMPGMPTPQAVRNWMKGDPEFAKAMEESRLAGCDVLAESCLQIADDGQNDYVVDEDGVSRVDTDHIQRSKLRVWTRLELLKKMHPKKYGDKVDLNHGGQAGNPVRLIATSMTPEESTQLYTEMLAIGR